MKSEEILKSAVEKALANGWDSQGISFMSNDEFLVYLTQSSGTDLKWLRFKVNELIFDHDFAKALWGEDVDSKLATHELHRVPARGYPGERLPREEVKIDSTDPEDWKCTKCHREWSKCFNTTCIVKVPAVKRRYGWKHHLSRMVIADDPVAYLGEHLPE